MEHPEIVAESWEGRAAAALAAAWGAPAVHLFEEVGSTSDVARRLAAGGAAAGTVVLGERQSAGRGRAGRRWESPPGTGLWLSLVVRPAPGEEPGALPIAVGHALLACLDPWLTPGAATLKWPNDLLAGGRKVGGILCESSWSGGVSSAVIVGIGLNVNEADPASGPGVPAGGSTLEAEGGRRVDRAALAACVVPAVLARVRQPLLLTAAELDSLANRDALRGQAVVVTEPVGGKKLHEGIAMGIAPDGALLLRDPAGVLRRIHSGTVRLS